MTKKTTKTKLLVIGFGLFSVILAAWLVDLWMKNYKLAQNQGVPVDTISVMQKNMPYIIELAGRAESYKTIEVKSLVAGQIIKVNCNEGQSVKINDLLFEIDSRNLKHQLEQAEANLLRDKIQLENAQKEESRYRTLFSQKAVSEEQYLQAKTTMNALKATVAADEAIIETAKLQLEYSKILAPIDGRLGEITFDAGNIVEIDTASPMVTINQISPIYITFSVPEQYLGSIRKSQETKGLLVIITTSSGEEIKDGEIVFIDNTIDVTSGTIKLKALFPNVNEILWPGQFVRLSLTIYDKQDAITIPTKALQINQKGQYVFVIGQDNKAEIRNITIDFSNDDYAVIAKGLQVGEKVVTNGQLRLSEGVLVNPKELQEGF